MKTIKLFLIATVFVLTSNVVFATGTKMNVVPIDDKKAYLALTNEEPVGFEIRVFNQQNELVYYKWVSKKTTSYHKVFDFSKMEEGKYQMEVRTKFTEINKEVIISKNELLVFNNEMKK